MNPDSAGIFRGLAKQELERQVATLVAKENLKFNLLNHTDFENDDYVAKKQQAELLCRAVVHLKTLRVYPSVQALPALLHQESLETLGHRYLERNINAPPASATALPAIQTQQKQRMAIEATQNDQ
jgi:hypothetical protein